jgi:hypothetical protein
MINPSEISIRQNGQAADHNKSEERKYLTPAIP